MMKKHYLFYLLFFIATAIPAAAQHYQPFKMGLTAYFAQADTVYSLRINQALAQGADSIFVFNNRAVPSHDTTVHGCNGGPAAGSSFLPSIRTADNLFGHQMAKGPAADYRFIFSTGDTFLLKPLAPVGQSWVFSAPRNLTASVTARQPAQVKSRPDSVAIIQLSNGDQIKISRSYGLIQAKDFNFYRSPQLSGSALMLEALAGAGIGAAPTSPFTIYDYQPGDKFLYSSGSTGQIGAPCSNSKSTVEVLSRNDAPAGDTIIYRLRRQSLTTTYGYCGTTAGMVLSPFDTVMFTVTAALGSHLFSLSQEYLEFPDTVNHYILPFNQHQYRSPFYNRIGTYFRHLTQDTCGHFFTDQVVNFMGYNRSESYVAGLGAVSNGTSHFYSGTGTEYTHSQNLVAYIKGTETYGQWRPLVLATEELQAQPDRVQAWPNPFQDQLTLKLPQTAEVEVAVSDLLGRLVLRQQLRTAGNQEASVALPALPAGVYVLQLKQGSQVYHLKIRRE